MSDKGMTHYVGDDCQGGHHQDGRIATLERQLAEVQARVEEAEERAELLEKWVSHSPACGYGPSRYRQSDGCDCGLTAERAAIVVTSSNMSKGV